VNESRLALFLMLGQSAERAIQAQPETVARESLPLSTSLDLALSLPKPARESNHASLAYRYFFVFESYLRNLIKETLSESNPTDWWEKKVPQDIRDEVSKSEQTEETKQWMALGIREKIALATYPQLLTIVEKCWKPDFEPIVRDKSLIQEARHISHLRNIVCHMTDISEEALERIKQVLRDWFRTVAP